MKYSQHFIGTYDAQTLHLENVSDLLGSTFTWNVERSDPGNSTDWTLSKKINKDQEVVLSERKHKGDIEIKIHAPNISI